MSADHHGTAVERGRDPVCGMSVRFDAATADGLVVDHDGRRYPFCREACRDEFLADPSRFEDRSAGLPLASGAPRIDDGMRRWYESCACCLSDAYPEVKAALDAEREAHHEPTADAGICEVAEAGSTST